MKNPINPGTDLKPVKEVTLVPPIEDQIEYLKKELDSTTTTAPEGCTCIIGPKPKDYTPCLVHKR
jgi:hypothetical protein